MQLYTGWVYMCVSQISNTISWLDCNLTSPNNSDKIISHEYYDWISQDFLERVVSMMLLTWNAYIYKYTTDSWKVFWLEVLRSDNLMLDTDTSGNLTNYRYYNGDINIRLELDEVIDIAMFSPFNALWTVQKGISPVQAIAMQMETDVTTNRWNRNMFKNGASVRDVLTTDKQLTKETKHRVLKKRRNDFQWVNNSNKAALLDNGVKYQSISPSKKELDFVESRRFTRDEVLAIFKIPKAIVGITDDVNRASATVAEEIYRKNCIQPIALKIENTLNKELFAWIGNFMFINVVPTDTEQLMKDYQMWAISLNEYRKARWYQKVNWWDVVVTWEVVEDPEQENKYAKTVKSIIRKNTKGTAEYKKAREEYWAKKWNKKILRQDKYEIQYENAVKKVFDQQKSAFIGKITKSNKKKLSKAFKQDIDNTLEDTLWSAVRLSSLKWVTEQIMQTEGNEALQEIGLTSLFNVWQPKTQKFIRDNINKLGKELDKTTKSKIFDIIEKWEEQWLWEQDVINNITSEFDNMKVSRVKAIARTEVTRAANKADQIAWKDNGVKFKEWFAELDNRTSDLCESLHWTIIPIDDDFAKKWQDVAGTEITYSNVPHPPAHVNCRSVLLPVID